MKAIVISGGGAKGAWAGGVAEYLHKELKRDWDIFLGSSTGSLVAVNLPFYKFDELKRMYTSVNNDSIFSVNPFNKKGKIKILNAIWRIIKKKKSFGEFGNLEKLLKNELNVEKFHEIKYSEKEVLVVSSNMSRGTADFFSSADLMYYEFIEAILASTSVPLAAEPVTINKDVYLDGGILEHAPIAKAIELGADEIDIIILRPEKFTDEHWEPENVFDVLLRTIDLLQREVSLSDVAIAELMSKIDKDVKLNFFYTPYELSRNSLNFNKEQMLKWWDEGYNEFKTKSFKTLHLKREK